MQPPLQERRACSRAAPLQLVRLPEVKAICGLSRSSIYVLIRAGSFPPSIVLCGRTRAWVRHEVESWVAQRIRASRAPAPSARK